MDEIFAAVQKELDALNADLADRGVVLSYDDALRFVTDEFMRLLGKVVPEKMN